MAHGATHDARDEAASREPATAGRSGARAAATAVLGLAGQEPVVVRRVWVAPAHVAFLKGLLEASRGLATLVAEQGGELRLVTTAEQAADLDELLEDLTGELSLRRLAPAPAVAARPRGGGGDHG